METQDLRPSASGVSRQRFRLACAKRWRYEAGVVTRERHKTFNFVNDLWDWLIKQTSKHRPLTIWCHNVGFDFTVAAGWSMVDKGVLKPRLLCTSAPPTILSFDTDRGKIEFIDTLNFFRCSLSELGESLGCRKLAMPARNARDSEWAEYCRVDVEIVYRAVTTLIQWVRDCGLGVLASTAPAQAMHSYRHRFAPKITIDTTDILDDGTIKAVQKDVLLPLIHRNQAALRLERDAYYGGECRCFYLGKVVTPDNMLRPCENALDPTLGPLPIGPIHHLDVTSLYPSVMAANPYPAIFRGILHRPSVATLRESINRVSVIARVRLHNTHYTYPVRRKHGTYYCTGTYWTALAGPELAEALVEGSVIECGEMAWYEPHVLFSDFVAYFRQKRCEYEQQGNGVMADLCKLMVNSLHGKFGQRKHVWEDEPVTVGERRWGRGIEPHPWTGDQTIVRYVAGYTQWYQPGGECDSSCPSISAYTASYARVVMKRLRKIAGETNIYYQDTDSLHVNDEGWLRLRCADLVMPSVMGKLRHVNKAATAEYRGIRDYTLDDVDTIAGLKRSAVATGESTWTQPQFESLDSVISRGPVDDIVVSETKIHRGSTYIHGEVLPDGTVKPWHLTPTKTEAWLDTLVDRTHCCPSAVH